MVEKTERTKFLCQLYFLIADKVGGEQAKIDPGQDSLVKLGVNNPW